MGAFEVDPRVAFGAALGVIFSAVYMLTLYKKVVFGEITNPKIETATDLNGREWANLSVLAVLAIYFGFFTTPITETTRASVTQLIEQYEAATTPDAEALDAFEPIQAAPQESEG